MTNAEKFQEVFGIAPDKYMCPISPEVGCELCPYGDNCNDNSVGVKFWKADYTEKDK